MRQRGDIATAHLGNWELAAAYLGIKRYPIKAIGAEQRDPRITDLISDLELHAVPKPLGRA